MLPTEDQIADATSNEAPIKIVETRPSLSAGVLLAGTRNLELRLSGPLAGPVDPSGCQLQAAGADGLLGTADDTVIPFSADLHASRLVLSCPTLSEGVYRLTLRDTLVDGAGRRWMETKTARRAAITCGSSSWTAGSATLDPTFGLDGIQLLDFGAGCSTTPRVLPFRPMGSWLWPAPARPAPASTLVWYVCCPTVNPMSRLARRGLSPRIWAVPGIWRMTWR